MLSGPIGSVTQPDTNTPVGASVVQDAGGRWRLVRRWLSNLDHATFLVLLGLLILPLLVFTYFPSQDGPSHVYNATVIAEYRQPDRTAFREYYVLQPRLQPNLLGHLVLAGLITVVSPLAAEKLLIGTYVVLFVVAMRYTLRAFGSTAPYVGLLAFPLVYNYALHMGFYNYALSIPLYLFVMGYWAAHRDGFTIKRAAVFGGLFFLLYLAHLLAAGLALMSITILVAGMLTEEMVRRSRDPQPAGHSLWSAFRRRAVLPLLATTPVWYLTIRYLAHSPGGSSSLPGAGDILSRLVSLPTLGGIVSLSSWEVPVVGLFALVVLGLSVLTIQGRLSGCARLHRGDSLVGVAGGMLLFYLLVPAHMAGGGYIAERMGVMIYVVVLLWLGVQSHPAAVVRLFRVAAVALTLALLLVRATSYGEINRLVAEYKAASDHVQLNTTLYSLSFAHAGRDVHGGKGAFAIKPFLHAAGYIAAERGAVLVNNYEGSLPYFPVQFRPEYRPDPYFEVQDAAGVPHVDLRGYALQTGAPVDYVLLWDQGGDERAIAGYQGVLQVISEQYQLAYRSPGSGRVELYRHRVTGYPDHRQFLMNEHVGSATLGNEWHDVGEFAASLPREQDRAVQVASGDDR